MTAMIVATVGLGISAIGAFSLVENQKLGLVIMGIGHVIMLGSMALKGL